MRKEKEVSSKITTIISITKTIIIVFVTLNSISLYLEKIKFSNKSLNTFDTICIAIVFTIMLLTSYIVWIILYRIVKAEKAKKSIVFNWKWAVDTLLLIVIISLPEYLYFKDSNEYKYIFIILILSCTIEYGSKYGIITALISALDILLFDLQFAPLINGINIEFQHDLIGSSIFIIVAWILGYYVDYVNKINEKQKEDLKNLNTSLKIKKKQHDELKHIIMNNEQCFDMIFENSFNAIAVHKDGKILYSNKKAKDIFGNNEDDEKLIYDFYEEDKRKNIINKYTNLNNGQLTQMVEEEILIDKKGRKIPVRNISSFFMYKNKAVILTMVNDITKEKQIKTLEYSIEKHSRMLNESRELNKNIRELFMKISHELKTPLNVMYTAIQAMNVEFARYNDIFKEKEKSYLHIMKQNCLRMDRVVNNFIDTNKLFTNSMFVNKHSGNIVETIENIVQIAAKYVGENVTFLFDTDVEEKSMFYDKNSIEKIILNLLSNAIKYSYNYVEIYVSLKDYNHGIEISVKDNGRGIPEEKKKEIFEIFGQVNTSLSRECEGVGLGLYIVKKLVEIHNGKINIISNENKGCEVNIYLPSVQIDDDKFVEKILDDSYEEKIEREFSDIYKIS